MTAGMTSPPAAYPPRVPPVEPELMASAIFLFSEYLARLANTLPEEEDGDAEEEDAPPIDTREVLDLLAEDLGTNVQQTLTLFMRVTALYRLLAASPSLARLAIDSEDPGGSLTENALVAAARLDLYVNHDAGEGAADFNAREFREALDQI